MPANLRRAVLRRVSKTKGFLAVSELRQRKGFLARRHDLDISTGSQLQDGRTCLCPLARIAVAVVVARGYLGLEAEGDYGVLGQAYFWASSD